MVLSEFKMPIAVSNQAISNELICALQNPLLFDHPVKQFSVIETHISWVILTGFFAYKIKKPVNLGFVDFSTLDRRRYFCIEELRLNRRFAPDIYLNVIPIRGSYLQPCFGNEGEVIEYAVKMREFSQQGLLNNYASEKQLKPAHIESLADVVGELHRIAPSAEPDSLFGSVGTVTEWTRENFEKIEAEVPKGMLPEYFESLKKWCLWSSDKRLSNIVKRQAKGFVRECHGDLHLGNIAFIDGRITPFDCIEFNPSLRWIDTTSEIAFVAMDLCAHGYPEYAWQFVNRYLQSSGDYAGIALLRYYFVYRAMVRAKVEALRVTQGNLAANHQDQSYHAARHYMDLAQQWATNHRPAVIIMHGLSGSGKSTLARQLTGIPGAIQIRSDVERKRIFDLDPEQDSKSTVAQNIYTQNATDRTYDQLENLAEEIILADFTVIIDASFLKVIHRDQFRQLALKHGVPFILLHCDASRDALRDRIVQRMESQLDPSEANLSVLQHQLETQEEITPKERNHVKIISSTEPILNPEKMHTLMLHIKPAVEI
jgi:aminoglycoside phosphotransferase family enzyme/predicted kinase